CIVLVYECKENAKRDDPEISAIFTSGSNKDVWTTLPKQFAGQRKVLHSEEGKIGITKEALKKRKIGAGCVRAAGTLGCNSPLRTLATCARVPARFSRDRSVVLHWA